MNGRAGPKDALSSVQVALNKVQLPPKKYFKIGEVAHLVGVEPHVLRYWQTQFPQVRPQKSRSGHRLYRRKDVETLLAVKELLHVQRFTIAGAKQALRLSVVQSDLPSEVQPSEIESELSSALDGEPLAVESFEAEFDDESDDDGVASIETASTGDTIELELIGVDGSELRAALDAELVARSAHAMEVVEISDDEPTEPPAAIVGPVGAFVHPYAAASPDAASSARDASHVPHARVADVVPVAKAAVHASRDGSGNGNGNGNGQQFVGVETRARARVGTHVVELRGSERAQLGFGFSPSARAALVEARAELADVLRALDAYVPVDRRRGGPGRR